MLCRSARQRGSQPATAMGRTDRTSSAQRLNGILRNRHDADRFADVMRIELVAGAHNQRYLQLWSGAA